MPSVFGGTRIGTIRKLGDEDGFQSGQYNLRIVRRVNGKEFFEASYVYPTLDKARHAAKKHRVQQLQETQ